jgi:hypothetical protein
MPTNPADLSRLPAARKLVADAERAGLRVVSANDDPFTRVVVASKDGTKIITAEWWDGSMVREFNYASVKDVPSGKTRRADSLKQARTIVGH